MIEPKLTAEQFKYTTSIAVNRSFVGRRIEVVFSNPKKLKAGKYGIIEASLDAYPLPVEEYSFLVIPRRFIASLPANKTHQIKISLG